VEAESAYAELQQLLTAAGMPLKGNVEDLDVHCAPF
jgi:hypothetical protein